MYSNNYLKNCVYFFLDKVNIFLFTYVKGLVLFSKTGKLGEATISSPNLLTIF